MSVILAPGGTDPIIVTGLVLVLVVVTSVGNDMKSFDFKS